jgi:copper transporter 1
MFAGSCIGVICLVICLEFLRRVGREYDAFIVRRAHLRKQYLSASASSQGLTRATDADASAEDSPNSTRGVEGAASKNTGQTVCSAFEDKTPVRPTLIEQLVRALLHMLQFAVAYFVMLLAMYFNGYIIICIFIGAFLGSFIFSWEPLNLQKEYVVPLPSPSSDDVQRARSDLCLCLGMMLRRSPNAADRCAPRSGLQFVESLFWLQMASRFKRPAQIRDRTRYLRVFII